jgi:hypothetical protein
MTRCKRTLLLLSLGGLFAGSLPARADLVVIMATQHTGMTLTARQVSDLYLGMSKALPDGQLASTAILNDSAATEHFLRGVLQKDRAQAEARWAMLEFTGRGTAPVEVSDNESMKKLVATTPGMIGIIDADAVDNTITVIMKHP